MIRLKRIGWENYPSTKTPRNAENLRKMEDNSEQAIRELETMYQAYVLYESEEGNNGEITIENLNEYKRMKIFFCGKGIAPGDIYSSQEVEVKNDNLFELAIIQKDTTQNVIFMKTKVMQISTAENKLKVTSFANWNTVQGLEDQGNNNTYITKILGYKN